MIQAMNNLNLLQKNDMLQTVKQQKINIIKTILLNLKQKALNQVFFIILMQLFQLQEIQQAVAANNNKDLVFKNCAPFSTCKAEINDVFIDEANPIYIAMPAYNLIGYNDNDSNTSGSLQQFKRDEVPANNDNLSINNSKSVKYKAGLVGETADAVINTNSSVEKHKNSCSIKIFE